MWEYNRHLFYRPIGEISQNLLLISHLAIGVSNNRLLTSGNNAITLKIIFSNLIHETDTSLALLNPKKLAKFGNHG
jgi:hypothetical protein